MGIGFGVQVRVSKRGNRIWSSGKGEGRRGNEFGGQARVGRRSGEGQSELR